MPISRSLARVAVMQALYTFFVKKNVSNPQTLLDFAFAYSGFDENRENKIEKKIKKLKIAKYQENELNCGYIDQEDIDSIEQRYSENNMTRIKNNTAFAQELFKEILNHKEEIKNKIVSALNEKDVNRIDPTTLAILYVGTYELCFGSTSVAKEVIISEAVRLAKTYSKNTGYALVNGILSKIAQNINH